MRYNEFEELFSAKRMQKYVAACNNDTRRAMTLYRYNLKLSQELFTIISCFEVVLRNHMFSNAAYALMGQSLLRIFPNKPRSSRQHRYDNTYIFQELDYINKLRNRIAHHEPICFARPNAVIDTSYVLNQYARMMRLFSWMGVDGPSLVYGLDHVTNVSGKVMCI